MLSGQIRWAILGTHWICEVMAKAIQDSSSAELIAIGSRDIERAKRFAQKFAITKYYDNYDRLLEDQDIDCVYIGLPNHLHKEWIIRCAKAGKHILCEKPFVLDVEEAQEVFSIVKASKVFCMEALMYRFHPVVDHLQQLIDQKVIGEIELMTATYTANIARFANQAAGGAIRNLGCYPLSLIRLLAKDEPIEIKANGQLDKENKNDKTAMASLKFKNGMMASVTTSEIVDMYWQFNVFGSFGMLQLNTNPWLGDFSNQMTIKCNETEEVIKVFADKSLYVYQIDYVTDCLRLGILMPNERGISWSHSLGNIVTMNAWLRQIKI